MTKYILPLSVSSDFEQGASNVSLDGSSFQVQFEEPIIIPNEAVNIYIKTTESTVWWNFANIKTNINDKLYITYFDGLLNFPTIITLEEGLYSLHDLNDEVNRLLVNSGLPNEIITISGNDSTQKSHIIINVLTPETVLIDFTPSDSIRDILGFNSQIIPAQSGIISISSDNLANFNSIDYLLIKSNIVSRGLRFNNTYKSIIAQILIDVEVGQQIKYREFNPPSIPCNELQGTHLSNLTFTLTDQSDNPVDTRGEIWTCRFEIHYTIPVVPEIH